jgi:DNA-binding transcriptional regulator YdaS (Cro superfamily)
MILKQYIQSERGNGMKLAEKLGVSISTISQFASGAKSISPAHAGVIFTFTAGKVSRQELRPDDFWRIWPDLAHFEPDEGEKA